MGEVATRGENNEMRQVARTDKSQVAGCASLYLPSLPLRSPVLDEEKTNRAKENETSEKVECQEMKDCEPERRPHTLQPTRPIQVGM